MTPQSPTWLRPCTWHPPTPATNPKSEPQNGCPTHTRTLRMSGIFAQSANPAKLTRCPRDSSDTKAAATATSIAGTAHHLPLPLPHPTSPTTKPAPPRTDLRAHPPAPQPPHRRLRLHDRTTSGRKARASPAQGIALGDPTSSKPKRAVTTLHRKTLPHPARPPKPIAGRASSGTGRYGSDGSRSRESHRRNDGAGDAEPADCESENRRNGREWRYDVDPN